MIFERGLFRPAGGRAPDALRPRIDEGGGKRRSTSL